ncbi:MAG: MarR family transcriptional regulator [Bacteroidota bacterium]
MLDDLSSLDRSLPYRLHRLGRLLRYNLHRFLADTGAAITPEQWFVLFALRGQDGLAQNELTDPTLDDRPNMTRLIGTLESEGLVSRQTDPHDGRRRLVRLTASGEALIDRVLVHAEAERQRMFAGLSPEQIDALDHAARIIERNLRDLPAA